ncbi:MAG: hypothetical protein Q4A01_01060 [Coriobacteriales bacterium]|nr:hypothetical protein [Coriobacteriales bacterium]
MTRRSYGTSCTGIAVALSLLMAFLGTPAVALGQEAVPAGEAVVETTEESPANPQGSDLAQTNPASPAQVQADGPGADGANGTGETVETTVVDEPAEEAAPVVEEAAEQDSVVVLDAQSIEAQEQGAPKDAGTDAAPGAALTTQSDAATPSVTYRTHVQRIGWQGWRSNGEMSGTSGKSRRLEGINIKLGDMPVSGGIQYRTHVQRIGWQGWRKDGQMSGTSGKSLRLEAIQIQLYGDMANNYDVWYRVHAQQIGWMGWAKNGEQSGTAGFSWRLEGIQIVLTPKDAGAPAADLGGLGQATDQPFCTHTSKKYRTLQQLGIDYGAGTNAKVDKALNALTRWCAVRGIDVNAKGTPNYHKAYAILAYVGTHYRYADGSYSAESMIDRGNGTCFAFSDLVMCFARKVGLTNSSLCVPGRPASGGGLFYGSQHRTVVSKFDGQYYDLDGNLAIYGYFSPRPISESYAKYLLGKTNTYTR